MSALESRPDGVSLRVRVIPRAHRNTLVSEETDHLVARLAAPPVEGKANEALRRLLADVLGVRASAVEIAVGEKARLKTVRVEGVSVDQARERIRASLGG